MNQNTSVDLKNLNAFLRKNKSVDFRQADLQHKRSIEAYKWGVSGEEKENLLKQLKGYQRLLRVLPEEIDATSIAKALLKKGIHSAFQITNLPKITFINDNLPIFAGDVALAERVYKRAIACRKRVTLNYVNRVQQLEPHARSAGLNL